MEERLYTTAGWLWKTLKHNGEYGREWWYVGTDVVWDVSNDGIWTLFDRDALGRPRYSRKTSVEATGEYPAQADIYVHYTYDAVGHVLREVTSNSSDPSQPGITISRSYNLAGQLISETNAQGLTTSYAYSSGGRVVTATFPGGGTKVTTRNFDGSAKSTTGSTIVSSSTNLSVVPSGTNSGFRVLRTYTAVDGGPRWAQLERDWLGRAVRGECPAPGGGVFQVSASYSSAGRLTGIAESGKASTIYSYDPLGDLEYTGLDIDHTGGLEPMSQDRITRTRFNYTYQDGAWWLQSLTYEYPNSNSSTSVLSAETLVRLTGFSGSLQAEKWRYDIFRNRTVETTCIDRNGRTIIESINVGDSSADIINVKRNGLPQSWQNPQSQCRKFRYDGLGRLVETIDPRLGSLTQGYFGTNESTGVRNQLAWTRDAAGNTTSYGYDHVTGRRALEIDALGKATQYAYDIHGRVVRVWGEATYPIEYEFNDYGEQTKLRTFRDLTASFSGASWPYSGYPSPAEKADCTTWNYDQSTGLLISRADAQGNSVSFTYNSRGQLSTRTWARGVATTFSYDINTSELMAAIYSDSTPTVAYGRDRRGLVASVSDYTGTRAFQHCDCGKVTGEYLSDFFQRRELHWFLDNATEGGKGRTINLTLSQNGNGVGEYNVGYGYDQFGRLCNIANVTYTYLPNSSLVSAVADVGAGWVQSRTYEAKRDIVSSIETTQSGRTVARFDYGYDALGRRVTRSEQGEMFSSYPGQALITSWVYNGLSEVTSSRSALQGSGALLTGRGFDYSYDAIGNRTATMIDGVSTTYTSNPLNTYRDRTVPGVAMAAGFAPSNASVTVNGYAASRHGEYFARIVEFPNASSPNWASLSVNSSYGGSSTRNVFVPKSPEEYSYDKDGNMLSDGRWTYNWDGENRLISMETRDIAYVVGAPRQHLEFRYDYLGRRVMKALYEWRSSGWALLSQRRFIYDGWNLIAEFDTTSAFSPVAQYVWGIDVSGTLQNAGGVGGLLSVKSFAGGRAELVLLPAYDGNGNICAMTERNTGAIRAAYEYSPFGETLRASGDMATSISFRFSTKYTDSETQLLYYGLRYYTPALGRFISRDPLGEGGGMNLYSFVRNAATNKVDAIGMFEVCVWEVVEWTPWGYDDDAGNYVPMGPRFRTSVQTCWQEPDPPDNSGVINRPGNPPNDGGAGTDPGPGGTPPKPPPDIPAVDPCQPGGVFFEKLKGTIAKLEEAQSAVVSASTGVMESQSKVDRIENDQAANVALDAANYMMMVLSAGSADGQMLNGLIGGPAFGAAQYAMTGKDDKVGLALVGAGTVTSMADGFAAILDYGPPPGTAPWESSKYTGPASLAVAVLSTARTYTNYFVDSSRARTQLYQDQGHLSGANQDYEFAKKAFDAANADYKANCP